MKFKKGDKVNWTYQNKNKKGFFESEISSNIFKVVYKNKKIGVLSSMLKKGW